MQSPTHIECSSIFLSQGTKTNTISSTSSHAKFQPVFPLSISLARIAFSLVNLRNVFRLIASGVNTEASAFYMVTSVRLVSYTLADLGSRGRSSHKDNKCFLMKTSAQHARIALTNFASLFSPATISLASLYKTHVCVQH